MKIWTKTEPFTWPVTETDPMAKEMPSPMQDSLGILRYVRYLGNTQPTKQNLQDHLFPSDDTNSNSLINLLSSKGVITKDEAKALIKDSKAKTN